MKSSSDNKGPDNDDEEEARLKWRRDGQHKWSIAETDDLGSNLSEFMYFHPKEFQSSDDQK